MMLCQQRTRYSVHIDREYWYKVHGLGLPFEHLYFEAREQLVDAMNALERLQAARLRDRSEPPRNSHGPAVEVHPMI
jgi:hypothetical protein